MLGEAVVAMDALERDPAGRRRRLGKLRDAAESGGVGRVTAACLARIYLNEQHDCHACEGNDLLSGYKGRKRSFDLY